jgi:hypothetical protein
MGALGEIGCPTLAEVSPADEGGGWRRASKYVQSKATSLLPVALHRCSCCSFQLPLQATPLASCHLPRPPGSSDLLVFHYMQG